MIKVLGCWEVGWNVPLTESDLWIMPLREFGVDELLMTPVSGIAYKRVREYPSVAEALGAHPNLTPVFVDEKGEVELEDFEHPEDAIYVFGKVSYSPYIQLGSGHKSVRIKTEAKGMLWPHQAMSIVLYDRTRK